MNISIRRPDAATVKRFGSGCVTGLGALLSGASLIVLTYHAVLFGLTGGTAGNTTPLVGSLVALLAGVAMVFRSLLPAVLQAVLEGLARLLAFPVFYVRENVWPTYFTVVGAGLAYALVSLFFNLGTSVTLYVLAGSTVAGCAGGLYHLLRHRWASYLALGLSAVLILAGVSLLNYNSAQVETYNQAMAANGAHEWEAQNKLLEGSIGAYERELRSNQLWQLLFPAPATDLAALAHFHKANGLLQSPNKGKEAYIELVKSLMRNPGNRYIGLSPEQAAVQEDNARHAQRNLEKLIRSGQDGGAGQPNGKQGQGQPQPGKQPGRDPGKEPQPGSGRHPRNSL